MMRAIWSGAISFGLIHIPVKLYNASEESELSFTLLRRKDQCPISHVRVCRDTREEVPYEEIVRGYEYEKGRYVVLEEEDFRRASVEKTQSMEILTFVDRSEIAFKFLEKPYFLEPDTGAEKPYALLREALKRSQRVGVAHFVLRTREHLVLLEPEGDLILADQMRFTSEIRPPEGLILPGDADLSLKEVDLAVELVNQLATRWNPEDYHDTYVKDLERLIQCRIEGREPEQPEVEDLPVEAGDLFSRLSESLKATKQKGAPSTSESKPAL